MFKEVLERARQRIEIVGECHIWKGDKKVQIKLPDGSVVHPRRLFYSEARDIPVATAPHLATECGNERCCNPAHALFLTEKRIKSREYACLVGIDVQAEKLAPKFTYPTPNQVKTIWGVEMSQDDIIQRLKEVPPAISAEPATYEEFASWFRYWVDESWFDQRSTAPEIVETLTDQCPYETIPESCVDRFWKENQPNA